MAYDPYGQPPPNNPNYVPTAAEMGAAQPVLATAVSPVPQKMDQAGAPGTGDISFLQGHDKLLLKQRFELLESIANAVGVGVIEFSNKYDIFDGNTGAPLLYAAEESNCLCRACCKPHHQAKLHVFDVRTGQAVPLFTVDKPFKFNCCICCRICQQSQTSSTSDGRVLGSAAQRFPFGGCFTPLVDIVDATNTKDFTLKGPCCLVGGAIELCFTQQFTLLDAGNQPVGKLLHLKPSEMGDTLKQVAGDSDNYLLEMPGGLSAEKTANLVGTMLLLDYLFFEGGPPFAITANGIECNICNMFCLGCLCPCTCSTGGSDGGDGGGDFGGDF